MARCKDDVSLRTKYELVALTARDLVNRERVVRAMRTALMGPLFEAASVNGAIARAADRCTSELNEILDELGRRARESDIGPRELGAPGTDRGIPRGTYDEGWCEVDFQPNDTLGGAVLKRASAVWWTCVGMLSLLLAGSVASDSNPVEAGAWVGRFIGAAFALLLSIWGLHRITCWLVDTFAKESTGAYIDDAGDAPARAGVP